MVVVAQMAIMLSAQVVQVVAVQEAKHQPEYLELQTQAVAVVAVGALQVQAGRVAQV